MACGPDPDAEREASREPTAAGVAPAPAAPAGRSPAGVALNLFASGLIVIAALAAGREVLIGWRTAGESPVGNAPDQDSTVDASLGPEWDFASGFFDVRFGDSPVTLRRERMTGDGREVLAALRRHSADVARGALAGERSAEHSNRAADDSPEGRLVAELASQAPAAGEPGRWALYEQLAPLPRNVVVSLPDRTIVAWGLAFPAPGDAEQEAGWSLFSWSVESGRVGASAGKTSGGGAETAADDDSAGRELAASVPRPRATTLGLVVRAADGGVLATFRTASGAAAVERHYDAWAASGGATVESTWRAVGPLRGARFRLPDGRRATVQLETSDPRTTRGILTLWRDADGGA